MTVIGLSVATDGNAVMVELPDSPHDQLQALYRLIGCGAVEAVVLGPDMLVWIDDNHIDPAAALNPVASTLAASVTGEADIHGVAVFTGPGDDAGDITSLSPRWRELIFRAAARSEPNDTRRC